MDVEIHNHASRYELFEHEFPHQRHTVVLPQITWNHDLYLSRERRVLSYLDRLHFVPQNPPVPPPFRCPYP